jgi:hypothetical protein
MVYDGLVYGPGAPAPPPGGWPPPKPITGGPSTMEMHARSLDPSTGLPRGEDLPAPTAAVVSLVSGVLVCLGPITGIAAIVAGLRAERQIREAAAATGGARMATFGIALGVLNLILWTGGVAIYVVISLQ